MIAYHFPPVAGSSGVQRTLKFSRYLPEFGWDNAVLTVHSRAYERTDDGQLRDIPADVPVVRAFALDTARHLRVLGSYPGILALPDRWVTWVVGAVPAGLSMIRRLKPDAIWCTYPIATAMLVGLSLSRLSGLPLVADFRDSMTEEGYPKDPRQHRAFTAIESRVLRHAARSVFTTPGARRMYRERYPEVAAGRLAIIENAFDDENFDAAEARIERPEQRAPGPFRVVHSGILYPEERDPGALFAALARLKRDGRLDAARFRLVLRASGHDRAHGSAIAAAGIDDLVELAPPMPYVDALAEMLRSDALLLMQASNCNHQIPAKLYEYLRAGRPVLALTDPAGDTAQTLRACGIETVAPLDDADAIARMIPEFIAGVRAGTISGATGEVAARNTRRARSEQLARLLDEVLDEARR